jgi:hypothetical protein
MDVMRTELKTLSLSSTFNDVINLLNNSLLTSFPLIDGTYNNTSNIKFEYKALNYRYRERNFLGLNF